MKTQRNLKTILTLTAALTALAAPLGSAIAADTQILRTGDTDAITHGYGRAGGLVGSDRVMALQHQKSSDPVTMMFDRDVAARTNMSLERADHPTVGIAFDEDVAARTNNSRVHPWVREIPPVSLAR
jgi:hypothetical protein